MAAVRKGVGRETAHEAIKEHAVAVALAMREPGRRDNDLLDRLAADERLGLSRAELDAAVTDPLDLAGTAGQQVAVLAARIARTRRRPSGGRRLPAGTCALDPAPPGVPTFPVECGQTWVRIAGSGLVYRHSTGNVDSRCIR